jgi:uncharacterized protein YegJ (DUF2314 family)
MTAGTIYINGENAAMLNAYRQAQASFKYCWRELTWENHRIVPALDLAYVKVAFTQQFAAGENPSVEHMWIDEVYFDGEMIHGVLLNEPNELTDFTEGDAVTVPLSQISDWLISRQGKTYGGFTIQVIRSEMDEQERSEHDEAWGLNFGDFNDIHIVCGQKDNPEYLIEHPMSINMQDKLREFLQENPQELTETSTSGLTMLHVEAIAGNKSTIAVLLELGADKNAKTQNGKTALDYAKQLDWQHIIPLLS